MLRAILIVMVIGVIANLFEYRMIGDIAKILLAPIYLIQDDLRLFWKFCPISVLGS